MIRWNHCIVVLTQEILLAYSLSGLFHQIMLRLFHINILFSSFFIKKVFWEKCMFLICFCIFNKKLSQHLVSLCANRTHVTRHYLIKKTFAFRIGIIFENHTYRRIMFSCFRMAQRHENWSYIFTMHDEHIFHDYQCSRTQCSTSFS